MKLVWTIPLIFLLSLVKISLSYENIAQGVSLHNGFNFVQDIN